MSFLEYVNLLCMGYVVWMFIGINDILVEIVVDCGILNLSYFYKLFLVYYGLMFVNYCKMF